MATNSSNMMKHLSSIANHVLRASALRIGSSVEELVAEFEGYIWKVDTNSSNKSDYWRRLVEYCSSKALKHFCRTLEETLSDGSFSRFTFDLMLAWEMPTSPLQHSHTENVGKGIEDMKIPLGNDDEIPLFYSDIMPLLVNEKPSVGEDAYVWLGTVVPVVSDVVSARFTFETLTAPTNNRLHFPAYDKFLREIHKSVKHLQKQAIPNGVELREDEFILHVDGTASSQRVIRHIGGTSWPGRLTLTNYGLYFEASGVLTYKDALKIDFMKSVDQSSIKPSATGPWGAPLFDKAIVFESSHLAEGIILEFPEMTSSTRRDHWLALTKEILLLHKFLLEFKVKSPIRAWEMHARTILGIIRLHAAREMLRISPPGPKKFLIFALFDEIAKGDYVLEKLGESLDHMNSGHPCSASSVLRRLNNAREACVSDCDEKECLSGPVDDVSSLESSIIRVRAEEKKITIAKATTEELREEGITNTAMVLIGLLKPLQSMFVLFRDILMWERPASTLFVIVTLLTVTYREWVGKGIAVMLLWVVAMMICARQKGMSEECREITVCKELPDQSAMDSVVSAQHGLRTAYEAMQLVNISLVKFWSIFISKTPKHTDMVMVVMSGMAIFVALVPTKYIIMGIIVFGFTMTSNIGKNFGTTKGNRRLKEWWDSIPVIPVRVVDKP